MRRSARLLLSAILVALAGGARAASPFGALVPVTPAEPSTRTAFRLIAAQEAERARVPYDLVDAVMKIESDYRPGTIGDVGEIGLMQVRPQTAAMLGFRGTPDELARPAVNIHYGSMYLGRAWRLAGGNVCRALMKYRAGHGEDTMSALSATYCTRARTHLLAMRSPLAATIALADLVADAAPVPLRDDAATPSRRGSKFWVAFKARIGRINARIEARWRQAAR